MEIGRKDIFWNYAATFLKIASSVLLLPIILKLMPSEMVGIWTVFMTITAFSGLLDFGFNPSFARNVSYIFGGVRSLKVKGFEYVHTENQSVDYGLLKGIISAMKWFYMRMAIVLFILLITLGTYYIYHLLQNYKGNQQDVYIAWFLLCIINAYNLFSIYYDALLQGKGLVKRSKQIVIIGQSIYLVIATTLIVNGYGIVSIVSAQASSVIIIRWLSYKSFFTKEIKQKLNAIKSYPRKDVLEAIYPNAIKIGLTSFGGFLVQRSSLIIGSLYLPLKEIAAYGITMQLISVIAGLAGIYTATYQPKIALLRVNNNNRSIKELYLKGQIILVFTYIICGIVLLSLGKWAFILIGSKTEFMPSLIVLVALIISFLESNHSIAGGILLSNNEVPFFKAALLSGAATILLLFLFFHYTNLSLWAMIIAPGIAQVVYQNWKWPLVVKKELEINSGDAYNVLKGFFYSNGNSKFKI